MGGGVEGKLSPYFDAVMFYVNAELHNILLCFIYVFGPNFLYLITEGLRQTDGRAVKHGSIYNLDKNNITCLQFAVYKHT